MTNIAVRIENISKLYRLGNTSVSTFKDDLNLLFKKIGSAILSKNAKSEDVPNKNELLWALKDVTFDIRQGEVMGIFGPNGAGKSTLLKIISKITEPTTGTIKVKGKIASLLEVGTGFHPDLTGRENIFLNGAILGMTRSEIQKKFDEIVSFSGVEKFIDTPVKRYSSGMYVRLAFSVAAHIEPEILILDEVLSVGDFEFQKKCLGKIDEVSKKDGRTVIFVSHNLGAISELCDRVTLLRNGQVEDIDTPNEIIDKYLSKKRREQEPMYIGPQSSNAEAYIKYIAIKTKEGEVRSEFDIAKPPVIEIIFSTNEKIKDLQVGLMLSKDDVPIFNSYDSDNLGMTTYEKNENVKFIYEINPVFLKAGKYTATVSIGDAKKNFDRLEHVVTFTLLEYSLDTLHKGYSQNRAGLVCGQGTWIKTSLK